MAHYKPKAASPIYSEARLILLTDPNLKYKEVFNKMTTTCSRGSIDAYGASIRHEIGCELRTVDGHERLEVNYVKYLAACKLYAVRPLTVKSLLKTRTKSRDVVVDEQLPPPPEEIIVPEMVSSEDTQAAVETINLPPYQVVIESFNLGGDVKAKKAKLNKAFEEAELRMSEASAKAKELESLRAMLLTQISKLDDKIGAQRQIIDEATQAMDVMLTLVDAPDAVIDLVL